jgi:hypothetical protein
LLRPAPNAASTAYPEEASEGSELLDEPPPPTLPPPSPGSLVVGLDVSMQLPPSSNWPHAANAGVGAATQVAEKSTKAAATAKGMRIILFS